MLVKLISFVASLCLVAFGTAFADSQGAELPTKPVTSVSGWVATGDPELVPSQILSENDQTFFVFPNKAFDEVISFFDGDEANSPELKVIRSGIYLLLPTTTHYRITARSFELDLSKAR